ncbi:MAG: FAD-binding oxidoreductase [Desulfovermiculus sp.]|nr:FAD-binding oxidoreductase [Desulfovermiculus sp.]
MKNPSRKQADVLIIGGGVIGCSIAYHLACRKVKATVLEAGDLAAGSSGACDGLVFLQSKKPGVHLDLALASRQRFLHLQDELPLPIEFSACGGLVAIEGQDQMQAMHAFVRRQTQGGLEISLLDSKQARELEPELSADIAGATWSALDGQVNPIALTHGLAMGAKEREVEILTGTEVTAFVWDKGKVRAVHTNRGRFEAQQVVLAAGVWTAILGAMFGMHIPIMPRKGQLAVTQPAGTLLLHPLLSATYIAAKFDPELAGSGEQGVSMEQTDHKTLLLGSTREFVGFDRSTTSQGIIGIAKRCTAIVPALKELHIIRSFAGLRPYTPDGLPILGPAPGVDNVYIAAGHEGDGIALAPITGELMAQMILEGKTDFPLNEFRMDRESLQG